jgi:AcrR family transcriptional regulator
MTRKSSAERRQEIVQAVLALIAELGIQGVTMGRIADKVGITEAALYRHFDSKLAIVGATIDAAFDELLSTLENSARGGTASELLRSALVAHLEFIEKRPGVARILFSDEVHFNSPALQEKLARRGEHVAGRIARILRAGISTGELNEELDVRSATVLYRGIVQAQVMLWARAQEHVGLVESVGGVWTLYERAIRK